MSLLIVLLAASMHESADEMFFELDNISFVYSIIDDNRYEELERTIQGNHLCRMKVKRLFFYSLSRNKTDCCLVLLKYINNVNEKFFLDNSYIQASTQFNNYDVTERLLEMGSDPNIKTMTNEYPILNCVKNSNYNLVDLLIKFGCGVSPLYPLFDTLRDNGRDEHVKKMINKMTFDNLLKYIHTTKYYKEMINAKINETIEALSKKTMDNKDVIYEIIKYL